MSVRPASIVPATPSCLRQNLSQGVSFSPKWLDGAQGVLGRTRGCERGRWVISLSGTNIPRPTPNATVPGSPSKYHSGKGGKSKSFGNTHLPSGVGPVAASSWRPNCVNFSPVARSAPVPAPAPIPTPSPSILFFIVNLSLRSRCNPGLSTFPMTVRTAIFTAR